MDDLEPLPLLLDTKLLKTLIDSSTASPKDLSEIHTNLQRHYLALTKYSAKVETMVIEREKAHNRTMDEMKDKLKYLESQYQKSKSEAST